MNNVRFGQYIKSKRDELNKSRAEFAQMLKISESYLYQIETGLKVPSADNMIDIAKSLNVRAGLFLELLDDRNKDIEVSKVSSLQFAVEPQFQNWITVDNINNISPTARRFISAIIREELE
jgi:transcriptional regulator with XRE-family HTH domain